MAKTPLNSFTFPDEYEESFYTTYTTGESEKDTSHYNLAENGNLVYTGGGTFAWNSGTGVLSWSATISITAHTTGPFFLTVAAGNATIQDGEVLFYKMGRQLVANQAVTILRSSRVFSEGTRLHELRLFCARVGTSLFFVNGETMLNGDSGTLFGRGIPGIVPVHKADLKIEPAAGTTSLDLNSDSAIGAATLVHVDLFRNGMLLATTDDYSVNLGTRIATLVAASVAGDRYVAKRRTGA